MSIQRTQRAVILEKSGTDVIVLLGSRGGEGACIVGLKGMTPEQSFELAQPWVEKFDGKTKFRKRPRTCKNRRAGLGNNRGGTYRIYRRV